MKDRTQQQFSYFPKNLDYFLCGGLSSRREQSSTTSMSSGSESNSKTSRKPKEKEKKESQRYREPKDLTLIKSRLDLIGSLLEPACESNAKLPIQRQRPLRPACLEMRKSA